MSFSKKQSPFSKFLLFILPVHRYIISGNSMVPALQNGSNILVNKILYLFTKPKIKDVVAVKDPRDGKILIKRINKIENGKYFITGDNKYASTDSRKFGMISRREIVGKVISNFS